jgi:hypothetical protein
MLRTSLILREQWSSGAVEQWSSGAVEQWSSWAVGRCSGGLGGASGEDEAAEGFEAADDLGWGAIRGARVVGGWGSYSMPSWMACAVASPAIRPARAKAMSMPEDTPAAVTYLPSKTTRSATGIAPC